MKKINLIFLVLLAIVLSAGDGGCGDGFETVVTDGMENPAKYQKAGKSVYETVKETDIDNESGLETAKNVIDSAKDVVGTVSFIPVVSNYAKPITIGLGVLSTVLGWFMHREKKKVKVVTERAEKSEKIADNYSESLDAARMEGDVKHSVEVEHLEKYLDKQTKAHFNATGGTVLE